MARDRIQMGDDEFILYIRKRVQDCKISNAELGRRIWAWLAANADAEAKQERQDQPCRWPPGSDLPQTAAQFSFRRSILPSLYDYLDTLGKNNLKKLED